MLGPMRRPYLTLVSAWLTVGLGELWFALQGFNTPPPWQVAGELGALALIGVCQAHFLRDGWLRSALWPGLVAVAWTAFAIGPSGPEALAFLGALAVATALCVRLLHRWTARFALLVGLGLAILGSVGARALVLTRATDFAGTGTRSAARDVRAQLGRELLRGPFPAAMPAPIEAPPVVIISIDTLRADAMLAMDSTRRLAARGSLWPRAMSTSSWTIPAMGSLLTGQLPSEHGAGIGEGGSYQGLAPSASPLAAELAAAGYTTAALSSNAWLTPALGFDRGFGTFLHTDEQLHHRLLITGFPLRVPLPHDARAVIDRSLRWLERAPDRGFFLWVHLMEPHRPYHHAEGGVAGDGSSADWTRDPAQIERTRAAYVAEVAWADAQVGRLLDALEARGVLEHGWVVLASDHGEELWEHGATGHGHQHHGEVVDVALVISGPGFEPVHRDDMASLADVAPTLRQLTGLAETGPDLREPSGADRVAVAYGNSQGPALRSARQGDQRAIVLDPEAGKVACYDLALDPLETSPQPCDPLDRAVRAAIEAGPPPDGEPAELHTEQLRQLGYIVD